jgi:hypothetical protein
MGFSIASLKPYPTKFSESSLVSTIRSTSLPKITWQKIHVNPYRVAVRMGRYCKQFLSLFKQYIAPITPETFQQDTKQEIGLENCRPENDEEQK